MKSILDQISPIKSVLLALVDILVILVGIGVSVAILQPQIHSVFSYYTGPTVFTIVLTTFLLYSFSLYDFKRFTSFGEMAIRGITAVFIANLALAALFFVLNHWLFDTNVFLLQGALTVLGILVIRGCLAIISQRLPKEKIIVIGAGKAGECIFDILGNRVVAFLDDNESLWTENSNGKPPVKGPLNNSLSILRKMKVKRVVMAITHHFSKELSALLLELRINGIDIELMPDIYEASLKKLPVHHIQDQWLIYQNGFFLYSHDITKKTKRAIDVLISGVSLILLSPLLVLTAVIIKLESEGPVIFSQERVGEKNKVYTLYKFRSMCNDSEKDGAKWAQKNDPRITTFGKFIRKVRIDELPQLWNVFKGNMTLIGPRPEQVKFVEELEKEIPYYYLRHTVKPGITGWAQIMYPYGATVEDAIHKLEYELYYIKNMSLLLDIKIMLKTIGVMLFGQGAR